MTLSPRVPASPQVTMLTHVRAQLALHHLRDGDAAHRSRPLLVLHGLGERAPAAAPPFTDVWPGPVHALDLTGHGHSSRSAGGGYTAEILMADVDAALAHLGRSTIIGRGLGAYVALLIAGARPDLVAGAVLCDGPGLAGGGPAPHSPAVLLPPSPVGPAASDDPSSPDPYALAELSRDVRPEDYATTYVRQAVQFSGLDDPISIAAVVRPPWLEAVAAEPGVVAEPVGQALIRHATAS